jgi:hypothetical protein
MSDAAVPTKPRTTFAPPAKIAAAPATPPKSGRMTLANITRGKIARPVRVLIYGVEGVGKSSFAACAPNPVFLGAEDGTSELDVARYPQPTTWMEGLEAIDDLTHGGTHDFGTLAIDTLDWIEPLCWAHVCANKRDKKNKRHEQIEEFGYGTGYNMALEYWRVLLTALERLSLARGMHVVLIAHSWIKNFKNPAGDDFDRYEMKLHSKAGGLMREWCDAQLFATHETFTHDSDGRTKGISSGARVLHTERDAAYDAKNRYDLPPKLPLDWEAFMDAVAAHRPNDPKRLAAQIERMLGDVDANLVARVQAAVVAANGDASELARIANKLAARISSTPTDDETTKEEQP